MLDFMHHLQGEVSCPARSESYSVCLDAIDESRSLLAQGAFGEGVPTAPMREIATLHAAISRWESEGGATSPS